MFRRRIVVLLVWLGIVLVAGGLLAQRSDPRVFGVFDGDEMYTVLPPGTIPAIDEPEFISGEAARAQMAGSELVMGIVVGGEARAYSAWQLDRHEIVNDRIAGSAIAVTW